MNKYTVWVKETSCIPVEIEAINAADALDAVYKGHGNVLYNQADYHSRFHPDHWTIVLPDGRELDAETLTEMVEANGDIPR